ncbi:MAG TPA: ABC transporter permease [Gemmatimonadaceae bacterium]|nr:ABC transporter permease [Gemmatimonadaceae bacterium]
MRRVFRLRFARRHLEDEIDEELRFHLAMREQSLVARGMAADAARAAARKNFGDVATVRASLLTLDQERERTMQRATFVDELRQDLMYAGRMLRRNPVFTLVAVATLALGIGANTAIFALVDAALLRRLDVPQAEQLVAVGNTARVGARSSGGPRADLLSYPAYQELQRRSRSFAGILASGRTPRLFMTVESSSTEPENPRGRFVSGNYFQVLRVPAFLGRTLAADDDANVGASPVVVISHDYWTRRFDANRSAIGRTIRINGAAVTIVGVTPPGFSGEIVGTNADLWIPLTMQPVIMANDNLLKDPRDAWLLLLGRLAPRHSLEQATSELVALVPRVLNDISPDADFTRSVANLTRSDIYVGDGSRGFSSVRATFFAPLLTLMAGVAVLLLIVCANVANLLLARATARGREMTLRVALGAARWRIVRQLLTESALLSLLGAIAGVFVGWWGSKLLLDIGADGGGAIALNVAVSMPVALFTMVASLLAVVLFGLAPALTTSRVNLASAMRAQSRSVAGGRSSRGGRTSPTRVVIAAQVALSLLLLVGAGVLVRSMWSLQNADIGMDREHLLIANLDARAGGYTGERFPPLVQALVQRMQRLPGVVAVSASENGLFNGTESTSTMSFEGFVARTQDDSLANWDEVGPGYAHAIGSRIIEGRDLTAADHGGTGGGSVLINQTAAQFFFHGGPAVGRRMQMDSMFYEVVGVITDAQDHDLRAMPVRRVYFPLLTPLEIGPLRIIIRTSGNPAAMAPVVRREIIAQDRNLPIYGVEPLSTLLRYSIRAERLVAKLAVGFGALALLLASIGLYGVMSYAISQRTGEIGVRMALGARPADVVRMVLWDATRVVLVGLGVGLVISLFAMRLLSGQLYGVGALDPAAVITAVAVLLMSGALAAFVPAMRGARVPPVEALRES